MAKNISAWVMENIPDDAVWGEYYVIAGKEETRRGSKVFVDQQVKPAREATITGKEIKEALSSNSSTAAGIGLITAGIIVGVLGFLLRDPEQESKGIIGIAIFIAAGLAIGGIYLLVTALKAAPEIRNISSWESAFPYIEAALSQKVFNEEDKKRREERGDKGAAYAGFFCLPARLAIKKEFDKARSNFGLAEELKEKLIQLASEVPEDGLELKKKG